MKFMSYEEIMLAPRDLILNNLHLSDNAGSAVHLLAKMPTDEQVAEESLLCDLFEF